MREDTITKIHEQTEKEIVVEQNKTAKKKRNNNPLILFGVLFSCNYNVLTD